ncbi:MAG: class I SAM-dependent methyltransferase [Candidatus Cloacimonadaceae bacterium]
MNYREHYRQDALQFDYWGKDQFSATEKRRNQAIFELSKVKAQDKVLDIGSGRGWFSFYAAEQGAEVTALDLSEENLARIKAINPEVHTAYGDACELPFADEKFDLIAALEVLEHIVDPKLAVTNWNKLLKPDGRLILTVPYKETIRYTLCIHCNQKTPVNAHLHSFDREYLIKLLNHHGFWVKQTGIFSHKLLAALRLNSLLQWLPFKVWKAIDKCFGVFGRKYSYLYIAAALKDN